LRSCYGDKSNLDRYIERKYKKKSKFVHYVVDDQGNLQKGVSGAAENPPHTSLPRSFDENFYRAVVGLELEHLKSTLQFPVALSSNTNTITHPNLIYSQDINAPDNTPSCANSQSLSECRFNRSYQRKPPLCRKHNGRDEKHTTCPLRAALRQKAQSTL